jgi:hypothetical protein
MDGRVSPRMPGSRVTWFIVGGVVALLVAGVADALRGSPPKAEETAHVPLAPNSAPATTTAPAPRCQINQLDLRIEPVGSDLALVLVHSEGPPCRTPRLPIDVTLLDGIGQPAKATASIQEFFAPTDHLRNVEVVAGLTVLYECGEAEPQRFAARVGPYSEYGRLPRYKALCLDDLGP